MSSYDASCDFSASSTPISRCLAPQQPGRLWSVWLTTHPRTRKTCTHLEQIGLSWRRIRIYFVLKDANASADAWGRFSLLFSSFYFFLVARGQCISYRISNAAFSLRYGAQKNPPRRKKKLSLRGAFSSLALFLALFYILPWFCPALIFFLLRPVAWARLFDILSRSALKESSPKFPEYSIIVVVGLRGGDVGLWTTSTGWRGIRGRAFPVQLCRSHREGERCKDRRTVGGKFVVCVLLGWSGPRRAILMVAAGS